MARLTREERREARHQRRADRKERREQRHEDRAERREERQDAREDRREGRQERREERRNPKPCTPPPPEKKPIPWMGIIIKILLWPLIAIISLKNKKGHRP